MSACTAPALLPIAASAPAPTAATACAESTVASASATHLSVPAELDLPGSKVTAFRHVRYPIRSKSQESMTPDTVANLPGTPPLDGLANAPPSPPLQTPANNDASAPPNLTREVTCPEERPRRRLAAEVLQRSARCFLARCARARLTSAVGRPAQVRVMSVTNLEMLCDYRDVLSMYCNIRVLKKPYGPFMFQFSSSKCTHVNLPTWDDDFFVPMISSRCELVVTLVGVTTMGKFRFLGQAVVPLETGWEKERSEIAAPLAKWKFPVDDTLLGLNRFVTGNVRCVITPLTERNTCMSGQFQMAPVVTVQRSSSFFGWTRRKSLSLSSPSPVSNAPPETPTSLRKEMVSRWGVLTDTHLHLFEHSTAKVLASLELSKLQLVRSSPLAKTSKSRREPGRLYALKIYCNGTMYSLFVSTYAQQLAWEYKIDLHRRQLLIP